MYLIHRQASDNKWRTLQPKGPLEPIQMDKKTNRAIIDSLNINHYIFLTRKDILGQAISNAIAQQTGPFISLNGKPNKKPTYSAEQIKGRIKFAITISKQ